MLIVNLLFYMDDMVNVEVSVIFFHGPWYKNYMLLVILAAFFSLLF